MRTNLDSVFFVSQAVAKHMIPRKRGKIINIGSVQSELARPSIAPYAASKGAVKMLTKGMCADWAPHGLQVNGIGPGNFETELTKPLVENAEFTAWLCKRDAGRALGEGRGAHGRRRVPRLGCVRLRERPHALRRWRDDERGLTAEQDQRQGTETRECRHCCRSRPSTRTRRRD
jgi:NAD(P)-dependent dehydrogenase (short-subunit alcohol dehydrogenase family)